MASSGVRNDAVLDSGPLPRRGHPHLQHRGQHAGRDRRLGPPRERRRGLRTGHVAPDGALGGLHGPAGRGAPSSRLNQQVTGELPAVTPTAAWPPATRITNGAPPLHRPAGHVHRARDRDRHRRAGPPSGPSPTGSCRRGSRSSDQPSIIGTPRAGHSADRPARDVRAGPDDGEPPVVPGQRADPGRRPADVPPHGRGQELRRPLRPPRPGGEPRRPGGGGRAPRWSTGCSTSWALRRSAAPRRSAGCPPRWPVDPGATGEPAPAVGLQWLRDGRAIPGATGAIAWWAPPTSAPIAVRVAGSAAGYEPYVATSAATASRPPGHPDAGRR